VKRTVKYALSAALVAALVAPALAQSDTPFPDTKENHWAYEAVNRLKAAGILVGYPNGTFIGGRLATRYEMAVAINAAYNKLKGMTDGLTKQIDEINSKISELQNRGGGASQTDLDDLKRQLGEVKDQVAGMKSYGQDIADLKKLTDKFSTDLTSLGADTDSMKSTLNGIEKRVSALEAKKLPIDIFGSVETFSLNGYSTSGSYGVDITGRPLGFGRGSSNGFPVGISQDFTFMHEVFTGFRTTNTTGAKGEAQIVASNMLGNFGLGIVNNFLFAGGPGFGSQNAQMAGVPYSEGNESVYIQRAFASYDWQAAGLSGSGRVGRIPLHLGNYILRRPDFTPYFHDPRWDGGNYDVDGAQLSAKIGNVRSSVFGARTSTASDTQGVLLQPMLVGRSYATASGVIPYGVTAPLMNVNQMLGATVMVPFGGGENGANLSYVLFDSSQFATDASFTGNANRLADYGGDARFMVGPFRLMGGYSRTDMYIDSHTVLTKNNQRATGYIGYNGDKWGATAGYRYIEPYYGAPGSWDRIGMWWNPTDIEGFDARAHVDVIPQLTVRGSFEYYTGTGKVAGGLTKDDKITRYTVGLSHKCGPSTTLDAGFEEVDWNLVGHTATPHERWYSIGATHSFSQRTSLSVMWQMSDYNGGNQPGFTLFAGSPAYGASGASVAKGGLITTQFTVRF